MNTIARILKELKPQDDDALDRLRGSGTLLFYKIISDYENHNVKVRICDDDNFVIIDGQVTPEIVVERTRFLVESHLADSANYVEYSLKYCDINRKSQAFYQRIWASDSGFAELPDCVRLATHLAEVPSLSLKINVVPLGSSSKRPSTRRGQFSRNEVWVTQEDSGRKRPIHIEPPPYGDHSVDTDSNVTKRREKKSQVAELDRIQEWAYEGDESLRDIRTLLITLDKVCFDEGWSGLSLKDVRDPSAVKKLYRVALLTFHPDKNEEDAAKSEIFHCLHRSYLAYNQNNKTGATI